MYGHGPEDFYSEDEDGFLDDGDYYEFKQRVKELQNAQRQREAESEEFRYKRKLQSILSAVSSGKVAVIVQELEEGLNPNITLENEWTPLLIAATVAHEQIISELLKKGAWVNHTRESFTALMYLCDISTDDERLKEKILACSKLLVNNGADVNITDRKRRNALMLAAYNGLLETVKFLLPLTNKDTEDNKRWTALFWATRGDQVDVVDFLLKEGFSCDKIDIRGRTVTDLAVMNGAEDILNLLPTDPYSEENKFHYLNHNNFAFEEIFANLKKNEKPVFFNDISRMLYGVNSKSAIPIFYHKSVTLFEFLSLNDSRLKDLGILLPYQRSRIIGGLFKFHKHPFQRKCIPFVGKNKVYSNVDVAVVLLSCIKQLIAMEGSIKFIIENSNDTVRFKESENVEFTLKQIHRDVKRLKFVSEKLVKKTEMWELIVKPADRITKKRLNIPWCNLILSVGVISLVAAFIKFK